MARIASAVLSVPWGPRADTMTERDAAAETEEELLARCRAGDRVALRDFYDRHASGVMRLARSLGLPQEEAEDVTQDVFAIAFQDVKLIRAATVSSWLFRLTSNRAHDRHRRRRVREAYQSLFRHEAPPPPPTPEGAMMNRDAETRVASILSRMSQKKREVFVLFELEELQGEAIADRLGIPIDTVWTRLHHARKDFIRFGRALDLIEASRRPGGSR